jgi:hypothetical protein
MSTSSFQALTAVNPLIHSLERYPEKPSPVSNAVSQLLLGVSVASDAKAILNSKARIRIYTKKRGSHLLTIFSAVTVFAALSAGVLAATDCEILNSGFPAINATDCCTRNGITCEDGRIVKM